MENVEAALAATTAPRVTAERIQAVIVGQTFSRLTGTLTVCVLTLVNGFTVTGESACASPENYDQDIGEHYARKDAERKIWPLEGYLLRDKLALAAAAPIVAGPGMGRFIGTKVVNAMPMNRQEYNDLRGWDLPADEDGTDDGMLVEYADGQRPNVDGFQGYVSWSPIDVFASAYAPIGVSPAQPVNLDVTEQPAPLPTDRREYGKGDLIPPDRFMDRSAPDIGFAVSAMRNGARVARAGWNGKGMFLYYVPDGAYPAQTDAAKKQWGEEALVPYGAYVAMKTAQDNVVPWLASQTDLLATDWCVLPD